MTLSDNSGGDGLEDPQVLYVPSDTWPDVVKYYSTALGQDPNPTGPPTAVFQLPSGNQLHITATEEREKIALGPVNFFLELPKIELVKIAYQAALAAGASAKIPLQKITIYPVNQECAGQTRQVTLTLGSVSFSSKLALGEDQVFGLSHNPNW
jgi:hypothetical protein